MSSRGSATWPLLLTSRAEGTGNYEQRRRKVALCHLDIEDLASAVGSAGRAGSVGTERCAALGALTELRGMPAVRGLAGAKAHL
jgi:hypothetical protein